MSTTRDLMLIDLYHVPRDNSMQALAARCSPVLYFDAREPFLPLAAGYTVFIQDGPSQSFDRYIELRPDNEDKEEQPPAALAIEYAIWWDWDIHHLYELEHVWVYLDTQGQIVRVEGSWHGKYYDIPLRLEEGHPVLLSEPGKHAFAPDASWFLERQREYRRSETRYVGAHAHVLINSMFAGKVRARMFDRVLVRSFLTHQAFTPEWSFTQRFAFEADWLVPWPALAGWIPQRVNAWLERLDANTRPSDYRALYLLTARGTLASLQAAARAGADAVNIPLFLEGNRLWLGDSQSAETLDLDDALAFLKSEPMGAFLELQDPAALDHLAWFVRSNELQGYTVVTSTDPHLLSLYNAYVPNSGTVIQLTSPDQDPIQAAKESGSLYVNPRWESLPDARQRLTSEWIQRVHDAGLAVVGWPVSTGDELEDLQRLGLDVICQANPH